MLKKLQNKEQGFTIIEVMIVLVIAAVILLIVFLAVPALQRNSRATQVKNEAAQVLSAASEWSSNNNGLVPTTNAQGTEISGLDKNKTLTTVEVYANNAVPTAATIQAAAASSKAFLITNAKCSGSNPATAVAGANRQIAVLYQAETGTNGAMTVACTESGL